MESVHPRTWRVVVVGIATALLATGALSGCLGVQEVDVLGTFYPMTFLAEEIGGDAVTVDLLMPANAEPHDWDPSVRDLTRLDAARLLVAQGLGFEPWVDRLVGNLGDEAPVVVYTGDGIEDVIVEEDGHDEDHEEDGHDEDHEGDPHEEEQSEEDDGHGHGPVDPHTWLDPVLFAKQAVVVRDAMIAAFPEHNETFRRNTDNLLARLQALDADYEHRLTECETRDIVVLHDAFGHLAHRYDIHVHSVTGLNPQAEPDPQAVARAVDKALEHDLRVVFTETLANPSVMDAIANDASAKGASVQVKVLSPVERRSPQETDGDQDYLDIMVKNLDALAEAMGCAA